MSARLSQLPVEALILPEDVLVRLSQLPVEVIYTLRVLGSLRLSQLAVEVIISNAVVPTTEDYSFLFVQCI